MMIKVNHLLYMAFMLINLPIHVSGQEIQQWSDTVQILGEDYLLRYDYYLQGNDTIKHGEYHLTKLINVQNKSPFFSTTTLSGYYTENAKDSIWEIRSGSFRPVGGGSLQVYKYAFNVSGQEIVAIGKFTQDKNEEVWYVYEWEINNSAIADTLLAAKIQGATKTDQGAIHVQRGVVEDFDVYFDTNLLADSTWTYRKTDSTFPITESYIFEDNLLREKTITQNNQQLTTTLLPEKTGIGKRLEIPINEQYIERIDFIEKIRNPEHEKFTSECGSSASLLLNTLEIIYELDSIFFITTGVSIIKPLKAKIAIYPVVDSEERWLDDIRMNLASIELQINDLLSDERFEVISQSNWAIARYLQVLKSIKEDVTDSHRILLDLYDQGQLLYVPRDLWLYRTLPLITEVSVNTLNAGNLDQSDYTIRNFTFVDSEVDLSTYVKHTEAILSEVKEIEDSLTLIVLELQNEKNLLDLELDLIEQINAVKQLNDSIITEAFTVISGFNANQSIHDFLDKTLIEYSKSNSGAEKLNQIEPIQNCVQAIERLIYTMENVPYNVDIIEDAYTRTVFNPYTFSNMEEKVKEPIYSSFQKVLLPGVFNNLQSLTCDNITATQQNFVNLFEGMIRLLKEETKKEERRIRRMEDKQVISDILKLELIFN